jgi:hypothetical protein
LKISSDPTRHLEERLTKSRATYSTISATIKAFPVTVSCT